MVLWLSLWCCSSFYFFTAQYCISINISPFNLPDRFHLCTYNYFMNEFMRLCLILLISIIIYYFTSVSITTSFWIFTLAIFFFHNWCLTFFRVYCKCWSCIYLSLDFPSIPKEFDTCLWLGNFCSNLQSLCLLFQSLPFLHKLCFSYQFHHLGFHPSALSSLEDLWLYFFDWFAIWSWWIFADWSNRWWSSTYRHIWESRADSCFPFLSTSASFIQLWIFCLNAHWLCSASLNHSSSFSFASACSIEFYSLCTSNMILKMASTCCI